MSCSQDSNYTTSEQKRQPMIQLKESQIINGKRIEHWKYF